METKKKEFIVVGLGEILWDIFSDGKQLGGAPANFALHSQNLGGKGIIVSSIGNDQLGKEIIKQLNAANLNSDYLFINQEYPTGTVTVELDKNGKPDYVIHENVAWDHIPFNENLTHLAQRLDAVCFGSLCQRSPNSRMTISRFLQATREECIRVFDINIRKTYYSKDLIDSMLKQANVFKLNDEEIELVADLLEISGSETDLLNQLVTRYQLDLVVLTKGANGSRLYSSNEEDEFEGFQLDKIADTVGAGDSFTAAVTTGLLLGKSLYEINRKANRIAGFVCSQKGAMPLLPENLRY